MSAADSSHNGGGQPAMVPQTKDLEGVSDSFKPLSTRDAKTTGGKRQKKIAVLTSGGDSAGMNAAGELSPPRGVV